MRTLFTTVTCALALAACTGEIGANRGNTGPSGANPSQNPNGSGGGQGGTAGGDGAQPGNYSGAAGVDTSPLTPFVAYESVARRMSQAELDSTLRDVFGDSTEPARQFLPEDEFRPYDNDYTVQQASKALIESLDALAEDVASRLLADSKSRARIVPCTPTGPGDTACFRQVVQTVGKRALRRPLRADEVDSYMTLQSFATESNPDVPHDFYTGVGLFMRALLQDPEFLYRIEAGKPTKDADVFSLDSYAIASRLSYLIWGSSPDDALLSAADDDALTSADARKAQAERLLADPRAKAQVHRFHALWLGYRAIPHSADLANAFNDETTHLIDRVVFEEHGDFLDLFQSKDTWLTDFLADHYGLPHPKDGAGWVPYGASGRAGILSHGSVLSAFSKFSDTSPTQRGILVRTRLLCETLGSPPAIVNVDQPPGTGTDAVCKYDRYAQHRQSSSSCNGCHKLMDPIGFGLEQYDVGGVLRDHDDGLPQCPIEGKGTVDGIGDFAGPAELEKLLVDSGRLDDCAVQQVLTFAAGHKLSRNELQDATARLATFRSAGRALDGLLVDVVASDAFALRKEPPAP
jgi:hypothetical protein